MEGETADTNPVFIRNRDRNVYRKDSPRTCTVDHGLLALVVQSSSNISKSSTRPDNSGISGRIESNGLEATHIDNQMTIFTTKTV